MLIHNGANNLDAELSQRFPRVEIVGTLVREAISTENLRNNTSVMLLGNTGLV